MTPNVSPASSGFAPPATTTQPQQQPTYTTAGTIYNPSAAIPIQPPTRRGRTFKWSSHVGHHTENPLFPRTSNFPSYYPVRAHIPMNVQQQYSPLQQNYDRAVNPLARMDEYPEELKVTVDSRQTSGAASAPLPVTSPKPKCGRDHLHSDEEDDADDAIQKTLLNTMTVKSLQNLASYPNPNQKDAQKALSRGSRPLSSLSSQHAACSSTSTSTSQDKTVPRTLKSPIQLRPTAEPYKSISQTGQSWAPSYPLPNTRTGDYIRFSQRLEEHKKELREKQEQRLRRERGEPSPEKLVTAIDMSECPNFRLPSPASSLASEPHGPALIPSVQNTVPKPLTAGPPGQRQLRSSTFEETFRALSNNGRTSHYQSDEEQPFVSNQQALSRMGIDDAPVTPETHPSAPDYHGYAIAHANYYHNVYYYAQAQAEAQSQAQAYGYNAAQTAGQYSAVGQQEAALAAPLVDESFVYQDWRVNGPLHGDPNWRDPEPSSRSRFQPGTDRLNDTELQARNDKTNKFWFSGVNMLEQRVEAQFGREENRDYGAIGEPIIHHGKRMNEYTYLSIEEVNATEVPEHSNYVLQVACVNVARVIEDVDKKVEDNRAEVLSQVDSLEGFPPPVDSSTWDEQSVEIAGEI